MAHDVFVSYAAEDKPIADAVVARLEAHRIRCWIAPRDVIASTSYAEAIVAAIGASRLMVLVFSSHANRSTQVRREVERVASKGIPILPFRIEDVAPSKDMEYFISGTHWLDAITPPLEQHMEHLAGTVELLLRNTSVAKPEASLSPGARPATTGAAPAPKRGLSGPARVGLIAGAVSVLAVLVGAGIFILVRSPGDNTPASGLVNGATPTATQPASAISAGLEATPSLWTVLWADDFSDAAKGLFPDNQQGSWNYILTTGAPYKSQWEYGYQGGTLNAVLRGPYPPNAPAGFLIGGGTNAAGKVLDDFAVEVKARAVKSPRQAVIGVRYVVSSGDNYWFGIKGDPVSYELWSDKEKKDLTSGRDPALKPLDQENLLRLEVRGDEMRILFNGVEVDRVRSPGLQQRGGAFTLEWGMTGPPADTDVEVQFRDFKVYGLAASASLAATPTVTATPIPTPVPTPTPTPLPHATGISGPLLFAAKLDGTEADIRWPRWRGGDPAATDVVFAPGSIRLSVFKDGGKSGFEFNSLNRLKYVVEYALAFTIGSDMTSQLYLRQGPSDNPGAIMLRINGTAEFMELIYEEYATATRQYSNQRLTPRINIPRLQTGRTFTLDISVDDDEYKLFLDGVQVAAVQDARFSRPSLPGVSIYGIVGEMRILGARVYEWPGTPAYVPAPIPAKGALVYQAKLDGTRNDLNPPYNIGTAGSGEWRYAPGSITLAVLGPGANFGSAWKTGGRLRYVVEYDLAFEPGSGVWFYWKLTGGGQGYEIVVMMSSQVSENGYLEVNFSQSGTAESLTPRILVPEIKTGAKFTVSAVVDEGRYVVYVNGTLVADVAYSGPDEPTTPGIAAGDNGGKTGAVVILGARIYSLQ